MMSFKLLNVDKEFERLSKELEKESKGKLPIRQIVAELKDATPVDTGLARDSWTTDGNKIENSVPYIEHLNRGSSKQAPAHFIENVCLKHGKAVGQIVETTPDA